MAHWLQSKLLLKRLAPITGWARGIFLIFSSLIALFTFSGCSISEGPLGDAGYSGLYTINCPVSDSLGRIVGNTLVRNSDANQTMRFNGVRLDSDSVELVDAFIVRGERPWGGGLEVPPKPDESGVVNPDSADFWNRREPLAGAELKPGESAVIILVVHQGATGLGASYGYEIDYSVGWLSYAYHRDEGIEFSLEDCAYNV